MPRARYWTFTSYEHGERPGLPEGATYITYQEERCPTTRRLHLQGYLATRRAIRLSEVKLLIPGAHFEQARSAAAINYCHKEDTRVDGPWEHGVRPRNGRPGQRTDLEEVCAKIVGGQRLHELIASNAALFVRNHNGLAKLDTIINDGRAKRDKAPDVWIYHGVSGSGKSRRAHLLGSENGATLYKKDSTRWWNGYNGQDFILFDDWVGSNELSPGELLSIVDRYDRGVEYKGGYTKLVTTKFIFTTNIEPGEWYRGTNHHTVWERTGFDAFMRRVDEGNGRYLTFWDHWDEQSEEQRNQK
jgi:Putative viral replication protein/RNA helicase